MEVWLKDWGAAHQFLDYTAFTQDHVRYERAWALGYAETGRGQYRLVVKEVTGYYDKDEVWQEDEGDIRSPLSQMCRPSKIYRTEMAFQQPARTLCAL